MASEKHSFFVPAGHHSHEPDKASHNHGVVGSREVVDSHERVGSHEAADGCSQVVVLHIPAVEAHNLLVDAHSQEVVHNLAEERALEAAARTLEAAARSLQEVGCRVEEERALLLVVLLLGLEVVLHSPVGVGETHSLLVVVVMSHIQVSVHLLAVLQEGGKHKDLMDSLVDVVQKHKGQKVWKYD